MKKVLAIVLCLLMLFTCVACGAEKTPASDGGSAAPSSQGGSSSSGGKSGGDKPVKDTISIGSQYDYGTLDCISMPSLGFEPLVCVMEPLWNCSLDGTLTPMLAESWEWEADDHMVVHMRQGIKFSNGNPFTADDVMFTLNLYKQTKTPYAPGRIQTTDFDRTCVRDEYTLDWYLKYPSILHYSVGGQLLIYDEESYTPDNQAVNPIGTGPYVVKEYVINSHCVVERRDDYWGEAPALREITFHILKEPSQRVNALETGLVDAAPIALADAEYVGSLPGIQLKYRPGSWINLVTNITQTWDDGTKRLMADPEARQAIYHAIDTEAISKLVFYGNARVMTTPYTSAIPDITDDMKGQGPYAEGYNLELAKQLAEKTGLVGKTLILANNGTAEHITISEMVQSMLAKIGITADIRSFDAASYSDVMYDKDAYDIAISSGVCSNMRLGDSFVNATKNSPISNLAENWANGHGQRYLDIRDSSLSTMDDAKRAEINKELMSIYIETSPTFGLVEYDSIYAFPEDLNIDEYSFRVMTIYWARDYAFKN